MGTLTKYEALLGELEPYTPSKLSAMKSLADAKVDNPNDPYDESKDKKTIAIAAIKVLKRMIVLTSDSLGKSSQGYNVEKLEERSKTYAMRMGWMFRIMSVFQLLRMALIYGSL